MPACTAKKILAAGCTGFLMSMAGSLVDAKKAIYDYRPAEDFETEGRDCTNKGVDRYIQVEIFDYNLRPKVFTRYTQVADECGNPIPEGTGVEWTMFYDHEVNGTIAGDPARRLQMDMYFCSPHAYFELEVTVMSDNGFTQGVAREMNKVAWEIEYGADEYHIWDTLNTPFFGEDNNFEDFAANGDDEADRPYAPIPPFTAAGESGTTYKWPYADAEGYYSTLLTSPFPPLKCDNLMPADTDYIGCYPEQGADWVQMRGPPVAADSKNGADDAESFRLYDGLDVNNVGDDAGLQTVGVMTPQICKDLCSGYSFFGLGKATECVCGDEVTGEHAPNCDLDDDDVIPEYQFLCSGDAAFLCGSATKYEIYTLDGSTVAPSPTPLTPAPITIPAGEYVELGCAVDNVPPGTRVMTDGPNTLADGTMSAAQCNALCTGLDPNYVYFGTQWGIECFCSESIPAVSLDHTGCDFACAGNAGETCGGTNAITVYLKGDAPPTTPSPVETPAPTPAPVETPAPTVEGGTPAPVPAGEYEELGCAVDNVPLGTRVMTDGPNTLADGTMSAAQCNALCTGLDPNYVYFGTQWGIECFCSESIPAVSLDHTGCDFACAGNAGETCGGTNAITVYQKGDAPPTTPSPVESPAPTPAPVETPAPTVEGVTPAPVPAGEYEELGCAVDNVPLGTRVMTDGPNTLADGTMSAAQCNTLCTGLDPNYVYFGTQWGIECFCSESIPAVSLDHTGCDFACAGNAGETCGGTNAITVYLKGDAPPTTPSPVESPAPTPAPVETPAPTVEGVTPAPVPAGEYEELGCAVDNVPLGTRVMTDGPNTLADGTMSAAQCNTLCTGLDPNYVYFGTQYGIECFCSESIPAVSLDHTGCDFACAGNSGETCGGNNAITVYLKGDAPPAEDPVTTPSPVEDETPAPVTPAPVGDAGAYEALGCWADPQDGARILSDRVQEDEPMSADICAGLCAGSAYFGMQYYSECWCGDSFDANAETEKNFRRCNLECNGFPDLLCGGINHIELFQFE